MKRLFIIVLIISFAFAITACSTPERDMEISNVPLDKEIDIEKLLVNLSSNWQEDDSGSFTYLTTYGGIITPFFDAEYEFPENKFIYKTLVGEKYKYGYMNETFTKLTDPISNEPNIFNYQMVRISTDSKSIVVDDSFVELAEYYPGFLLLGNNLIKVNWTDRVIDEPYYISDVDFDKYLVPVNVNAVTKNNDKQVEPLYGYKTINDAYFNNSKQSENFVIAPAFHSAELFSDGLAAVEVNGEWGYIDESGEIVIELEYDKAGEFQHGVAPVYDAEYFKPGDLLKYDYTNENDLGRWGLINTRGSSMTRFMYRSISPFVNGLVFAVIATDPRIDLNMYTILRPDGSRIHDEMYLYDTPSPFSSGLTPAQDVFLDENGKTYFYKKFRLVRGFSDGLAAVIPNGKMRWGYVDTVGDLVLPVQYVYACAFDDGYAFVKDHYTKEGYLIDKLGNIYLKELNLHGISKFNENGFALAYKMETIEQEVKNEVTGSLEMQSIELYTYYMIHIEN